MSKLDLKKPVQTKEGEPVTHRPDGTPLTIPKLPELPGYKVEYRGGAWTARNVQYIYYCKEVDEHYWDTAYHNDDVSHTGGLSDTHYAELIPIKPSKLDRLKAKLSKREEQAARLRERIKEEGGAV